MSFSFFPVEPSGDHENPFDQRHERQPSFEPPRDEVPVLFPASEVVGRGDDVVIALMGARVYSDGIEILLDRHLRRGGRDAREWQLAQMDFNGHFHMGERSPDRLRWGLALGDGQHLLVDEAFGMRMDQDPSDEGPAPHTVRPTGGGGNGGADEYVMHDGLWLHRLPPEGPLEIVVQWPAFGVAESRVVLDAGRIRALAASVRPLWP
ncbi:hypothetical protein DEU35_1219 [Microbacterium sp. AG157]|uniref:hypothetical protein n=1 Tax=Microbacterium sp. AG157 TaxID=2183993 RepID=UPI000E2862D1|nr:hypothetical protein [Microbacterium sp. AG157]REC98126.1 hypothetical protein DEU35_1219 [Microbacterium sp. AG157]